MNEGEKIKLRWWDPVRPGWWMGRKGQFIYMQPHSSSDDDSSFVDTGPLQASPGWAQLPWQVEFMLYVGGSGRPQASGIFQAGPRLHRTWGVVSMRGEHSGVQSRSNYVSDEI